MESPQNTYALDRLQEALDGVLDGKIERADYELKLYQVGSECGRKGIPLGRVSNALHAFMAQGIKPAAGYLAEGYFVEVAKSTVSYGGFDRQTQPEKERIVTFGKDLARSFVEAIEKSHQS